MTTRWALLLHFYQPPTQTHDVLRRIADESYRPLIEVLGESPGARVAVNMNAVLSEMLDDHGLGDVVTGLRGLAERGIVEFTGSGRFHPILPLVPHSQAVRAITEHHQVNRRLFGEVWRPRGFFPPEMCYAREILGPISAAGHDWVMVSGVACPVAWPVDRVHRVQVDGRKIAVLFRDDIRSNRISFRETTAGTFLEEAARIGGGQDAYVVTAMDAETYGHHIRGWEREFLGETLQRLAATGADASQPAAVKMVFPSEVVDQFPAGDLVEPFASSWSTTRDDIAAHDPYPLWQSPGNRVHTLQWEYVEHCHELVAVAERYAENAEAKRFAKLAGDRLQPALHSCQFWWASRRPMWDVVLIYRGLQLLNEVAVFGSKAVQAGAAPARVKREAAWRLAAAQDARAAIERSLVMDGVV